MLLKTTCVQIINILRRMDSQKNGHYFDEKLIEQLHRQLILCNMKTTRPRGVVHFRSPAVFTKTRFLLDRVSCRVVLFEISCQMIDLVQIISYGKTRRPVYQGHLLRLD